MSGQGIDDGEVVINKEVRNYRNFNTVRVL